MARYLQHPAPSPGHRRSATRLTMAAQHHTPTSCLSRTTPRAQRSAPFAMLEKYPSARTESSADAASQAKKSASKNAITISLSFNALKKSALSPTIDSIVLSSCNMCNPCPFNMCYLCPFAVHWERGQRPREIVLPFHTIAAANREISPTPLFGYSPLNAE